MREPAASVMTHHDSSQIIHPLERAAGPVGMPTGVENYNPLLPRNQLFNYGISAGYGYPRIDYLFCHELIKIFFIYFKTLIGKYLLCNADMGQVR